MAGLGGAVGLNVDMDAGEVKGVEERVHPPVGLLGGKVYSVDPVGAQGGGKEKNVLFVVQGHLKAVKGLPGHPAVAEADIVQTPQLIQIGAQAPQVLQLLRCGAGTPPPAAEASAAAASARASPAPAGRSRPKGRRNPGTDRRGRNPGARRLVGHLLRPGASRAA